MKAFVLKERGREGCAFAEANRPEPGAGEVLVRMLAASLNRVDIYMRDNGAGITHTLPQIMGIDGVGEIVSAPEGSPLTKGTRVILYPYEFCGECHYCLAGDQPLCVEAKIVGEHRNGTLGEYVVMQEHSVIPVSPDTDPLEGAAIGVAYLTAWRMVFGKTPLQPGQTVLVQGAGGGVSFAAAQLALMVGARVIVTTSGEDKLERCRKADFHALDYKDKDVLRAIMKLTKGEGADLVVDNVGEATWPLTMRSVRRGGHVVTCGATTGSQPGADLQRLFIRQISVHGSTMGSLAEFENLVSCFERGLFKVPIDATFPLSETAAALDRLEAPDRFGKVVVHIADPEQGAAD